MKKETKNEKSMFSKISQTKRWVAIIIAVVLGFFILSCTNVMGQNNNMDKKLFDTTQIELIDSPIEMNYVLPHDSIRIEMVEEAKKYLAKATKGKADPNLAEYLVDNALEHDIDLCFMMSQTKIETCFGTAGVGRSSSRRSLFGVIKKKYPNYDDAIDDYCKLLKKSYLVKGRTEKDLMRRYVTGSGYRYASNPNYERELSGTYKEITRSTNLSNLQAKYNYHYKEYLASLEQTETNSDSVSVESMT